MNFLINCLYLLYFIIFFGLIVCQIILIYLPRLKWLSHFIFKIFCFNLSIIIFFFKEHRLWFILFIRAFDLEFINLHTREWFLNWLNWNLVHIEYVFLYMRIIRFFYTFLVTIFYSFIYLPFILKYNRILRISYFFSIKQRNFFLYNKLFILIFKLSYIFKPFLVCKIWLLFLWWRGYSFIISRLDFNLLFWNIFQPLEVREKLRGFSLEPNKMERILYLKFLRPLFISNSDFNLYKSHKNSILLKIFIFIWIQFLSFFKLNFLFCSHKLKCYIYLISIPKCWNFFPWFSFIFMYVFNNLLLNTYLLRQFIFKCLYLFSVSILHLYYFFYIICWAFFFTIIKIIKISLIICIVLIFGLSFIYNLFEWWIPYLFEVFRFQGGYLEAGVSDSSFIIPDWVTFVPSLPSYLNVDYLSENLSELPYHRLIYDLKHLWHRRGEYDYLVNSYRQTGKIKDDDGELLEDWQRLDVWRESFKWIPAARLSETDFNLWAEDIHLVDLPDFVEILYDNYIDLISLQRCLETKLYDYNYYKVLYKSYRVIPLWSEFIFSKQFYKRKWEKRSILGYILRHKFVLALNLLVIPYLNFFVVWRSRIKFYIILVVIDKYIVFFFSSWIFYFGSNRYVFVLSVKLYKLFISYVPFFCKLYNLFIKFYLNISLLYYNYYKLYNFKFKLLLPDYWSLFYINSESLFIKLYNLSLKIYIFFFFETIYIYSFFLLHEFTNKIVLRPISGKLIKSIVLFREYLKSCLDVFYLEYDSLIHRRFKYVPQYVRLRKRRYKNKKDWLLKTGFLIRIGIHKLLKYPNSITPFFFTRFLNLDYNSRNYWQINRYQWFKYWYLTVHRFFRSVDFSILSVWFWCLLCWAFSIGFRHLFKYKSLEEYNSWFYWYKIRQYPMSNFSDIFNKVDLQSIRSELNGMLVNLEFNSRTWVGDFKAGIELTSEESADLKAYYKQSLHSVLKNTKSFKWRIRRLRTDLIRNWDKVEYFFFNKSTENYFKTFAEHSIWLGLLIYELILSTKNKDFYGLYLSSIDEDDIEESFEFSLDSVKRLQFLTNKIFYFYASIDKLVFNFKLPKWIWHKNNFLRYTWLHVNNENFNSVSFEDLVIPVIGPFFILSLYIPLFFCYGLRGKLGVNDGWKYMKWSLILFKITLWYHWDLYADMSNLTMRAFFNAESFFMIRGRFTMKSGHMMRRKKLKWHKRFIWHYLNTCYTEFMLIRSYMNRFYWSGSQFSDRLYSKRGNLIQSFTEFKYLLILIYILILISVIYSYKILFKFCKNKFLQYRSVLYVGGKFELILHWMQLRIFLYQKFKMKQFLKKRLLNRV